MEYFNNQYGFQDQFQKYKSQVTDFRKEVENYKQKNQALKNSINDYDIYLELKKDQVQSQMLQFGLMNKNTVLKKLKFIKPDQTFQVFSNIINSVKTNVAELKSAVQIKFEEDIMNDKQGDNTNINLTQIKQIKKQILEKKNKDKDDIEQIMEKGKQVLLRAQESKQESIKKKDKNIQWEIPDYLKQQMDEIEQEKERQKQFRLNLIEQNKEELQTLSDELFHQHADQYNLEKAFNSIELQNSNYKEKINYQYIYMKSMMEKIQQFTLKNEKVTMSHDPKLLKLLQSMQPKQLEDLKDNLLIKNQKIDEYMKYLEQYIQDMKQQNQEKQKEKLLNQSETESCISNNLKNQDESKLNNKISNKISNKKRFIQISNVQLGKQPTKFEEISSNDFPNWPSIQQININDTQDQNSLINISENYNKDNLKYNQKRFNFNATGQSQNEMSQDQTQNTFKLSRNANNTQSLPTLNAKQFTQMAFKNYDFLDDIKSSGFFPDQQNATPQQQEFQQKVLKNIIQLQDQNSDNFQAFALQWQLNEYFSLKNVDHKLRALYFFEAKNFFLDMEFLEDNFDEIEQMNASQSFQSDTNFSQIILIKKSFKLDKSNKLDKLNFLNKFFKLRIKVIYFLFRSNENLQIKLKNQKDQKQKMKIIKKYNLNKWKNYLKEK